MRALEIVIVPVAGCINEDLPPLSEDWVKAEVTGVLPEVSDIEFTCTKSGIPDLMFTLLSMAGNHTELKGMQTAIFRRVVLPVLRNSQLEHEKWLTLFLAKYKAPFCTQCPSRTPGGAGGLGPRAHLLLSG